MTPDLQAHVIDRLVDTEAADKPLALVVLAALEGESQLNAYLDGADVAAPPLPAARATTPRAGPTVEPPGLYVSSITVEGFRGVGSAATLELRPGPGLTLVVGRNGSGKSSFAEGLEFLLTGHNFRWEKRAKVWVEGWRNLHQHGRVSLKAELLVEGRGPVTVAREWQGDDLDAHVAVARAPGRSAEPLETFGWAQALVTFRPFLSYNELGSLLEEGPSKLYDALSSVLGLDEFVAVQALLSRVRKARQLVIDEATQRAATLAASVGQRTLDSPDPRLVRAAEALHGPSWDIARLSTLVSGEPTSASAELDILRRLAGLQVPDVEIVASVVERLRASERAYALYAGTNAERSRERAKLLEDGLRFHERHRVSDCPVCGTEDVLLPSWRTAARSEIEKLRREASACEIADAHCKAAVRDAQKLLTPTPPVLSEAAGLSLQSLPLAQRLWTAWSEAADLDSATALADHFETRILELTEAVRLVADEARGELSRREDVWRPIAADIAEWLPRGRAALRASETVTDLKAAEAWWKDATAAIRDERFAPIEDRALGVWQRLRLQSHVDLGGVELEGTAGRRRVALRVTVDGSPGEALGVMSQGELHSLALSLFLPRATLPESPFRFISIDDPVQSMDPARVEGLAQTLADVARTRQVIVFTHDDRLPEAVRRLGIPATILGVTRRGLSVVEVREVTDPVTGHLDDARAVALTNDLPADVAARVVPGFCRAAIEAACMNTVRHRRLAKGERHEDIETLLADHARPHPLMALALFDDETRTGDVLSRLSKVGRWAVDVFQACKSGAHEGHDGDLRDLISSSERLARWLVAGVK